MLVYLVRHAEAAPGEPDELRPLTEEGRRQARAVGQHLAAQEPPASVRTSPLLRARQTGDAIARAAGIASQPDYRLAPGATTAGVLEVAAECDAPVAIIGHQPDCGLIAAEVTGAEKPFPPAAVVRLEL